MFQRGFGDLYLIVLRIDVANHGPNDTRSQQDRFGLSQLQVLFEHHQGIGHRKDQQCGVTYGRLGKRQCVMGGGSKGRKREQQKGK